MGHCIASYTRYNCKYNIAQMEFLMKKSGYLLMLISLILVKPVYATKADFLKNAFEKHPITTSLIAANIIAYGALVGTDKANKKTFWPAPSYEALYKVAFCSNLTKEEKEDVANSSALLPSSPIRLASYGFTHSCLLHLLCNMYA